MCVVAQEGDVEAMLQGRSGEVGVPVKERRVGSPFQPSSCSRDLMQFEGDTVLLLLHQGVQRVRVAQV